MKMNNNRTVRLRWVEPRLTGSDDQMDCYLDNQDKCREEDSVQIWPRRPTYSQARGGGDAKKISKRIDDFT